jgi:dTDP-4-dehydrorhamnose 3,5-epimerase-like enzyme
MGDDCAADGALDLRGEPPGDSRLLLEQPRLRGLYYHERGQDDLFVRPAGMVRVVVLGRTTGEAFTEYIGDDNPVAIYVTGVHSHGYEALTDALFAYLVTEEYDPAEPGEQGISWSDPRVRHLWSTDSPILSARDLDVSVM